LDKQFEKHKKKLLRDISNDDYEKLTQIPMIRITRFDGSKADEKMLSLQDQIKEKEAQLSNLIEYTIEFFKNLKKKYGKGRERKTEVRAFETIVATNVVIASEKLYVNREEGFAGFSLKKDEYISDCSTIDDIIVIRDDGTMTVSKVSEKAFVGKNILHIAVFQKNDERTVYNLIYQDGPKGNVMMKRFSVTGVTRDKVYDLTRGNKGSKVLYLTANPNGESEVVSIQLKPVPNMKKSMFDIDFATLAIKGRNSQGNIVTKYSVKKITQTEKGISTLGARMMWFDDSVQRLNVDGRGTYLGEFAADDKILSITQSGYYRLHNFDLSNHFDEDLILIEKFNSQKPITAVYLDGSKKEYYAKRFMADVTDKKTLFISESEGSYLELATTQLRPIIDVVFAKSKDKELPDEDINLVDFEDVKGLKAKGKRLSTNKIKEINLRPSIEEKLDATFSAEDGISKDIDFQRINSIRQQLDDLENQMTLDF
jgi:topoisomerase-4 subunit A